MAAILNSAILNLAILDSAILVFPLKLIHTCQDWFPPFAQKNLHSFILTQLENGSHLEFYCCWIKKTSLIDSDSTWWWQSSWILPCWIQTPCFLLSDFTQKHSHSTLTLTQTNSIWLKIIHSDSTWWWQPSWILPCWIQTPCFLLSDSLKNMLPPLWLWLKLIQSDSNSFILTQLDDGNHLEFGHHGFSYLIFSSQTHSHLPGLVPTICTKKTTLTFPSPPFAQKILHSFILTQLDDGSHLEFYHVGLKTSLIHTDSTWWWQPSWILPCWIQTPCFLLSDSLKNTLPPLWLWLKLIQSDSNLFILTQLDDGSHLEFCHLEFGHLGFSHLSFSSQTHSHLPRWVPTICTKKTFTHSFWLNLMMATTLNSTMLDSDTAILDSDTFLSSLRFTQKHSPSTLTLDSN